MKRRALRITVFLLLGAIVNVAVAWGCAIWADEKDGVLLGDATIDLILLTYVAEAGESFHHRSGTEGSGTGVRRTVAVGIGEDGIRYYGFHSVCTGLPMRSMGGELTVAKSVWDTPWRSTWAIRLSPRIQEEIYGYAPGIVPLRPLWPGFAINTVFYAFVLWLLFAGPFVWRRRRRIRRGLCPKCAYDLRGTPSGVACPECGAAVIRG